MFSNIGRKIKVLAKVFCWLGIIGSVIIGVLMISGSSYTTAISGMLNGNAAGSLGAFGGIVFIIVGSLLSWISSFVLYGFGELVDNSSELVYLKTHERKP